MCVHLYETFSDNTCVDSPAKKHRPWSACVAPARWRGSKFLLPVNFRCFKLRLLPYRSADY